MADSFVQVPPDSTGKKVDASSLDVGLNTVLRQRIIIADNSATSTYAVVTSASAAAGDAGMVVVPKTATVVLAAGTANIGTINNISATVTVAGTVSLGASTANIGTLNNVSATIAAVLAAGTANIGTINNISATINAVVAGPVAEALSVTVGNAPVLLGGRCLLSASAGVGSGQAVFSWMDPNGRQVVVANHPSRLATASHGPALKTASTSANVALVAAPGVGLSIHVTMIGSSNASGTASRARIADSTTVQLSMMMAANGGGFVMNFDPPWKLAANNPLNCSVKPNVADGLFNVHFFVAP